MKKSMLLTVILAMCLMLTSCVGINADDLLEKIKPNPVDGKPSDASFLDAQFGLGAALLGKAVEAKPNENVLISPLSVMTALAMTANGAKGKTLTEMEAVLGGLGINDLNAYLHTVLEKAAAQERYRLHIADSIWFRDSLPVNDAFLQKNVDWFGAQIFKTAFDANTARDINAWVNLHTDGMIKKIIDEVEADSAMYLVNALAFDAKWVDPYEEYAVRDGLFHGKNGDETVKMMHSAEHCYLEDESSVGFAKYYEGGARFVALLPNEGVSVDEYVKTLTAEKIAALLDNADRSVSVNAAMPKFSFEYGTEMNGMLISLGMPTAFGSDADFSGMSSEPLYIGKVLHKTFIDVNEAGTKAAAVTSVEMKCESAGPCEVMTVTLDRPFVFMILDETNDPLFMGVVNTVE